MSSAAFTFAFYIVGHFSADLRNFKDAVNSPVAGALARGLYWVLPNLAQFDIKNTVVHGQPVPAGYMGLVTAYGAAYIAIVCLIPEILISYASVPFYFGGTSLLIVVSVTMDTVAQVQGYLLAHQYEGLIKRSKLKGRRR